MAYPSGHRDEVRGKIVASARRLFNRHGFDAVSVDSIMSGAGLTRGGFYSYFTSKTDLYTEALKCFFTEPDWENAWKGIEIDPLSEYFGPQVVSAYLSRQHFEDVENSCPMVALPGDVTRSGVEARHAFETVFRAMVGVLESSIESGGASGGSKAAHVSMGNGSAGSRNGSVVSAKVKPRQPANGIPRHAAAQAMAALCIGGMVVARALESRELADELRDACTTVAFSLGGWKDEEKAAPKKRRR
jgi:AcrR family transcriptional regulator